MTPLKGSFWDQENDSFERVKTILLNFQCKLWLFCLLIRNYLVKFNGRGGYMHKANFSLNMEFSATF